MKSFLTLLLLWLSAFPMVRAQSDDSVKLVHLVVEKTKVVASNVKFSRFDELKLNARERILDRVVADSVFIIVTTQRFIGYGTLSGFRTLRTETGESLEQLEAEDFSALIVTNKRLINFNGKSGLWGERERP